ncbi:MAG: hypothetical protein GX335_04230 [Firmicutes bacterium]|nr:hypothetical protein [Bacillota bacterium]
MTAARKLTEDYAVHDYDQEIIRPNPKRKRFRVPPTLKICLLAAICVAVSLLYLEQQVTSFHLNMQLTQLDEQVKLLEQHNEHLLVNLETQMSLQKIEDIARNQLGMVDPDRTTSLVLDSKAPLAPSERRWADQNSPVPDKRGVFAVLASWLNKAFPLGGVEAGTLQR